MNDPLVANLYDLWEAGYSFLPRMGKIYEELWDTLPSDCGEAFSSPVGGDSDGVEESWESLRDTVATIFSMSSTNLYDTGDALVKIVESYEENDQLNASEIDDLKSRISGGESKMEDGELPAPPDRNPPEGRDSTPPIYINQESDSGSGDMDDEQ